MWSMITIPIEDVEGLVRAVEDFFGPDIFVHSSETETKTANLHKYGKAIKDILDKKRNAEAEAKRIYETIEALPTADRLAEMNGLQEFLDDTCHDLASNEGSDINNEGIEAQIAFVIEELAMAEAKRQLNVWFDGRLEF